MNYRSRIFGYPNLVMQIAYPEIMNSVRPSSDERILDIGCGSGYITYELSKFCELAVGIDVSYSTFSGIDYATALRLRLLGGSIYELPFGNNVFDKILLSKNFPAFSNNPDTCIQEIARVLKPNGRVVIVDSEIDKNVHRLYTDENLKDRRVTRYLKKILGYPDDIEQYYNVFYPYSFTPTGKKLFFSEEREKTIVGLWEGYGYRLVGKRYHFKKVTHLMLSFITQVNFILHIPYFKTHPNYIIFYPYFKVLDTLDRRKGRDFTLTFEKADGA